MSPFSIGQLAKKTHVKVQTVRYYERRGLIPNPPRRESGYRQFSETDVERIRFIKYAQSIGFTLNEIAEMIALIIEPSATCGDVSKRIDAKLCDVENKIKTLLMMKNTLIDLKKGCKEPDLSSKDCPILESLDTEKDGVDE
ncbi:Transcriptional regulator, MerR family [hydrothermal vent metagenome]|uniref:Transcriptional regulator, MerR family n=1 Tax=hydrothermal vent metagenome TaxID=652676 RepID=A0A3B1CL23_9ZZZZ